jgi:hypothetical protein
VQVQVEEEKGQNPKVNELGGFTMLIDRILNLRRKQPQRVEATKYSQRLC